MYLLGMCENDRQTNWSQYVKLILDYNDQCVYEPVFNGDSIETRKQTVLSFVIHLCVSATMIRWVYALCLNRGSTMNSTSSSNINVEYQRTTGNQNQQSDHNSLEFFTGSELASMIAISSLAPANNANILSDLSNKDDAVNNNNSKTILEQHPYNEQINFDGLQRQFEPLMNYSRSLLSDNLEEPSNTKYNANLNYSYSQICTIS
ncbi:unnamed protein product [Rotaria magnacalcarata]|uniref:Uncharacterized protein n=2 Tax=Rotaria magnacalcarata TaxID=392030 RepID=A0A815S502_9BILA|nr:unnamed protein product [Rotaria magnacalcarata]CAF2064720.1 unnamed protein product [Rotaria magnacalcarata]